MQDDTAKIFVTQNMCESELIELACGLVGVFSKGSPDGDHINQDAAAVISLSKNEAVLVVADGLGGSRAGEKAAEIAVQSVSACVLDGNAKGVETRIAILDGFELANERICELGIGAATTLAVLTIQGRTVRSFHVGDSAILGLGRGGKLKFQTLPHAPISYAVESGLMGEDEAIRHKERNIVSNVLGSDDMRIEIGPPIELSPNDTVLLSSDGLFDNLLTSEIIELARKGSLESVLQALSTECAHRMGASDKSLPSKPDDLTILTFRPKGGPE